MNKTKYVYELYNNHNVVEYVGESVNPKGRLISHKANCKGSGSGKFYNRPDIKMRIVAEFEDKKEAYQYQIQLQKKYNLETDNEKRKVNCVNGGKAVINKLIQHNRDTGHTKNLLCILHSKEVRAKAGLKLRKSVLLYNDITQLEFESITEAANYIKCVPNNISQALSGKQKTVKGYKVIKL